MMKQSGSLWFVRTEGKVKVNDRIPNRTGFLLDGKKQTKLRTTS